MDSALVARELGLDMVRKPAPPGGVYRISAR